MRVARDPPQHVFQRLAAFPSPSTMLFDEISPWKPRKY